MLSASASSTSFTTLCRISQPFFRSILPVELIVLDSCHHGREQALRLKSCQNPQPYNVHPKPQPQCNILSL